MRIEAEKLRLYAVTDRVRARSAAELLAQVAAAIEGGAGVVQLREKELPYGEFLAEAREFVALCRSMGAVSIINDSVEIGRGDGRRRRPRGPGRHGRAPRAGDTGPWQDNTASRRTRWPRPGRPGKWGPTTWRRGAAFVTGTKGRR